MASVVSIETSDAANIAARYARFVQDFKFSEVPDAVVERALLSILDGIGVGLAATRYEFARTTVAAMAELGGAGDYPVIGSALRLPLRDAAVANGTLIHGLDYDDTHSASIVHTTASALPMMLGMGQAFAASGAQALAAYLIAVEAAARIGQVAEGRFQAVGFHPTGVVGAFGSVLGAAALKGLSADQVVNAQGIVLSFASGSLEFLNGGAWTKRIHPGWAAAAGVTAATLASHGFVGPTEPYDGRYGLFNAYLGEDAARPLDLAFTSLGTEWEMLRVAIKPYPVCHFNHAFADGVLSLRQREGLSAADVESMTACIHPKQIPVVCEPPALKQKPQSDYDAKFSVQFVMAAAMVRGRFTLEELEDEALNDAEILALCQRVDFEPWLESRYPAYYSGQVRIRCYDGREFIHTEAVNRGADERPLTAEQVEEKFFDSAGYAVDPKQAAAIRDAVFALPTARDLNELLAAVAAPALL